MGDSAPLTDDEMTSYDMFAGDKDDPTTFKRVSVVRVRKPQKCSDSAVPGRPLHYIKPGERARLDEAVLDGKWERFYTCEPCLRRYYEGDF